ncbi:hypothetical protein DFQ26_004787 [Actinomortierella ambigua]|nr:hypothetical protein DFQ26_004787 [Actinomortierella ambigua]
MHSTPGTRRSSGFQSVSEKQHQHQKQQQQQHQQPTVTTATVEEKRQAVSYLRQKIFHRATTLELWDAYRRVVPLQAVHLIAHEDIVSLFELLSLSPRVEESTEMMIQVAPQQQHQQYLLPPRAQDILLRQMVDQLPAERVKQAIAQMTENGPRGQFVSEAVLACETNGEMVRVLDLYRTLVKQGHAVDSASTFYRDRRELAERLGRTLSDWLKTECSTSSAEHATAPLHVPVQEYVLTFMLDRGLYDEAYGSMVMLAAKLGTKFSVGMYTTAIHRFGLAGRSDYMDILVERMKHQGIEPTIAIYSALIDVYAKSGNLREAQKAYQEILAAGLTPTAATFGPMLEAVGRMGDYEMTKQLAEQMNASGVASNAYTLNALLQATVTDPEWSLEVFEQMTRQEGIEPSVANYNMLLRTFRLHGDLDGAFRVYRWWRTRDGHLRPNEKTFSTLLSLFADRGEVEGGEALWDEMVHVLGVQPNVYVYASMIHLYCTAEDMMAAHGVYREMIQIGIKPNLVIFGTLLNAYARYGDLTQMLSIYDVMRSEGLKPNSFVYTNLLLGLVQDGDLTAARRLYANMEEDGFGQNVLAQTIMMRGYLQQGKRDEAFKLYHHMVRSGQVPNYLTYATLVQADVKRKDTKAARALINRLVHARELVELGDEHQALAAAMDTLGGPSDEDDEEYSKAGRLGSSVGDREVFGSATTTKTMSAAASRGGLHADPLDRYEEEGDEEDAEDDEFDDRVLGRAAQGQFTQTGTEGQPLKAYFKATMLALYPPLLDAYAKEGNVLASEELFREMKARHLQPNTIMFTMLMDSYRRAGMVDRVVQIWEKLNEQYTSQLRSRRRYGGGSGPRWSSRSSHELNNDSNTIEQETESKHDQRSTKPYRLRRVMQHPISIVVDSLSYSGRIHEAMEIWRGLEAEGAELDSTNWNDYCIALARNGRLLQACQVMKRELLRGHWGISDDAGTSGSHGSEKGNDDNGDNRTRHWSTAARGTGRNAAAEDSNMLKTLNFPRPRTFAALADALDQLLEGMVDYNTSSLNYIKESLRQGAIGGASSSSAVPSSSTSAKSAATAEQESLHTLETMLDKKLGTYPHPFEEFELGQRNMLWEAIRTQYPEVLRAVCEGYLVSQTGEASYARPAPQESKATTEKKWQGFRPWRGVSSYLRDYDGQPKNSNQRYSRSADADQYQ